MAIKEFCKFTLGSLCFEPSAAVTHVAAAMPPPPPVSLQEVLACADSSHVGVKLSALPLRAHPSSTSLQFHKHFVSHKT